MLTRKGQFVTFFASAMSLVFWTLYLGALHFTSPSSVGLVACIAGLSITVVRTVMYTYNSLDRDDGSKKLKKQTPFFRAVEYFREHKDADGRYTKYPVFIFWQIVFRGGELSVTVGVLAILQYLSGGAIVSIVNFKMLFLSLAIAIVSAAFVVGWPNRNPGTLTYGKLGDPNNLP
jgi:hypothetical protein